jgi:lysozyme family protein
MTKTPALLALYQRLFDTAVIRPNRVSELTAIVKQILANRQRYEGIAEKANCPWWLVACIHNMECSLSFSKHLHNGDSLQKRTWQIPAGRPVRGTPPFTFEESALDALEYDGLLGSKGHSIPEFLYHFEKFNGWGYRTKGINSPYLWSYTNHYVKGKYVRDGVFDRDAVSLQCGIAAIMRRLAEFGLLDDEPTNYSDPVRQDPYPYQTIKWSAKEPNEAVKTITRPYQEWLNKQPGIYVLADGWAHNKTSDATKKVFGVYLEGDPRR